MADPRGGYALGGLAYELLTAQHLFRVTNLFDLVQEKLSVPLPGPADIGTGISHEIHEFLRDALRVNPATRPSSLSRFVEWAATCESRPTTCWTEDR